MRKHSIAVGMSGHAVFWSPVLHSSSELWTKPGQQSNWVPWKWHYVQSLHLSALYGRVRARGLKLISFLAATVTYFIGFQPFLFLAHFPHRNNENLFLNLLAFNCRKLEICKRYSDTTTQCQIFHPSILHHLLSPAGSGTLDKRLTYYFLCDFFWSVDVPHSRLGFQAKVQTNKLI